MIDDDFTEHDTGGAGDTFGPVPSRCDKCGSPGHFRTDPLCEGCAMREVEESRALDEVIQAKQLLQSAMARYAELDEGGQDSREDDMARILSQIHPAGSREADWCREEEVK